MKQKHYSEEFKEQALAKVFGRSSEQSVDSIADGLKMSKGTLRNWMKRSLLEQKTPRLQVGADARTLRHEAPSHKLSLLERAAVLAVANSAEYGHLPPSQIVPRLADQQRYVASESTFYRFLREENQLAHRRPERVAQKRSKPRAACATQPNQLYSWDITYRTPRRCRSPPHEGEATLEHVWNAGSYEPDIFLLRERVSRSGGDLSDTDKVTKSAGNGA